MDLSFSPREEAFRRELRAWLSTNVPSAWGDSAEPERLADEVALLIEWQKRLYAGGWVGVHWPAA